MPCGKGYAFWTWPVLTLALLDTEYFRKTRNNVKNRTKCDANFFIGQEQKSICLTLGKGYSFGNGCKNSLVNIGPELVPSHEKGKRARLLMDLVIAVFRLLPLGRLMSLKDGRAPGRGSQRITVLSSSLSRPRHEQWALTGAVSSRLSNSGEVLHLAPNM